MDLQGHMASSSHLLETSTVLNGFGVFDAATCFYEQMLRSSHGITLTIQPRQEHSKLQ
jgi:hypothetical protein